MAWQIPLTELTIGEDDVAAVVQCLEEGWLTMGPRVDEFEQGVAAFCGTPHGAAVNCGTAALHLACRALGLGPGDEVIVPALTFVASVNAPRYVGATPVLCDTASPIDMNLSVESVEPHITDRTRAVIAVHFCGYPANVGRSSGRADALCDGNKYRSTPGYLWDRNCYARPGAAKDTGSGRKLQPGIEARRRTVKLYRELLADVPGVELTWSDEQVERSSHFAFPILLDDAEACDAVRTGLADRGIQTTRYPVIHGFSEYRGLAPTGSLPFSETAAARHCALPLSASTIETEVERVVGAVRATLPVDASRRASC